MICSHFKWLAEKVHHVVKNKKKRKKKWNSTSQSIDVLHVIRPIISSFPRLVFVWNVGCETFVSRIAGYSTNEWKSIEQKHCHVRSNHLNILLAYDVGFKGFFIEHSKVVNFNGSAWQTSRIERNNRVKCSNNEPFYMLHLVSLAPIYGSAISIYRSLNSLTAEFLLKKKNKIKEAEALVFSSNCRPVKPPLFSVKQLMLAKYKNEIEMNECSKKWRCLFQIFAILLIFHSIFLKIWYFVFIIHKQQHAKSQQ